MEETIENIVTKLDFEKSDLFRKLLNKSIKTSEDSAKSTYAVYDNVIFHMDVLWKGFSPFNNAMGKNKKYVCGTTVLSTILEELGVEVEDSECFLLFHIRELGKFRLKATKLHDELKALWHTHKEYAMDDGEFAYALKSLMKKDLIEYRKGNLHFKPSVIIRYKNREF